MVEEVGMGRLELGRKREQEAGLKALFSVRRK
jgi:hypothetical protein